MTKTEIINGIIKHHGFKSYLEIGVGNGKNLDNIQCKNKYGVDVSDLSNLKLDCALHYKISSNDFFDCLGDGMSENVTDFPTHYDCILIDGNHTYTQSKKDLYNAFKHLNHKGLVLLHNTNPKNIHEITPTNNGKAWCGEVWKTVLEAKSDGYVIRTMPDDYGLTIINNEDVIESNPVPLPTSQEFIKNKSKLMNFVSYKNYIDSAVFKEETKEEVLSPPVKDTNDIQVEDVNNMTDEELKDLHKYIFGKKPKGRFVREKVINKIIN